MNEAAILSVVIGVVIAIVLARLAVVERRLNRLSRMDAKIDASYRMRESISIHFGTCRQMFEKHSNAGRRFWRSCAIDKQQGLG